jgi:hypothetical protein
MIKIDSLADATLEELNEELAAAGFESTHTDLHSARLAVASLMAETPGYHLMAYDNAEPLRAATAAEILESALSGPEGVIEIDGVSCYVEQ